MLALQPSASRASAGSGRAAIQPPLPSALSLPCPLEAGWETLLTVRLPRFEGGRPSGGFSALTYDPDSDLLELLSDAPHGFVQRWSGLRGLVSAAFKGPTLPRPSLQSRGILTLHSGSVRLPDEMDGEGMVRLAGDLWVASEGRRSAARPAQLLRFDAASGALREALALPTAWQPTPGQGLEANKGPESLTLWRPTGGHERLLMASEAALLQDPPGLVRLLEWRISPSGATTRPLRSLALPGAGLWSLTELLSVPQGRGATGLLALSRRFEEPDRWGARLLLYPTPTPTSTATGAGAGSGSRGGRGDDAPSGPQPPWHSWDLLASGSGRPGLPADNWEGLSWGPPLADGRATLVLVTDDNFSPFQTTWLAVLAPRRLEGCAVPRARSPRTTGRHGGAMEAP